MRGWRWRPRAGEERRYACEEVVASDEGALSRRTWVTRFTVVAEDAGEVVLSSSESNPALSVVDPPWLAPALESIYRALGPRTPELMLHTRSGSGLLGPIDESLWVERMQEAVQEGLAAARVVPEVAENYLTLEQSLTDPDALLEGAMRAPRMLLAWAQIDEGRLQARYRTQLDTPYGQVSAVARVVDAPGAEGDGLTRRLRQFIEPDAEGQARLSDLAAEHGLDEGASARAWLDVGLSEVEGWPVMVVRREEHAIPGGIRRTGLSMLWDGLPRLA